MSGYVPNWFEYGKTVIYQGKEEKLKDYFFTSSPIHNSDHFNIVLESGVRFQPNKQFYDENNDFIPAKYLVIESNFIDNRIEELEKKIKQGEKQPGIVVLGEYKNELSILKRIRKHCSYIKPHIEKAWEAGIAYQKKQLPERLINPLKNFVTFNEFIEENGY